ncbi:unnamed protein product [Allacma fusca]|uniref:Uncharacterized protein n=1 Tax=Allacma fusca TaxID=39272 RepID=A0A8J2NZ11_9HEXA|nr:unnamed protein product [Allacma fusca]
MRSKNRVGYIEGTEQGYKRYIDRLEQKMTVSARREDEVAVPEVRQNLAQHFVTITEDDNEKHNLYLPKSTLNQLLAATVQREEVIILLLHFYDIPARIYVDGEDKRLGTQTGQSMMINRKKKDVKASVTALLQFFKNQYDTAGKRNPPLQKNETNLNDLGMEIKELTKKILINI